LERHGLLILPKSNGRWKGDKMIALENWPRYFGTVYAEDPKQKRVSEVDFKFVLKDAVGTIHVTDLQLQEGSSISGFVPANQEMLKRETDSSGTAIENRHFNVVIRGEKTIGVPNRALPSEEQDLQDRVSGGMDFTFHPTQDVPSGLHFAHYFETRTFDLQQSLKAGDLFEFKATTRTIAVNSASTKNYEGFFLLVPAILGKYNVAVQNNTDAEGSYHGSGYLLCEADTWIRGKGGERM